MNEVLDRIDILILRELQKDAKLTTKELLLVKILFFLVIMMLCCSRHVDVILSYE